MSETQWVSPQRIDPSLDMLPVHVSDCNFGLLVFTWMLPGPLDRRSLTDAVSRTLTHYPLFAGRLVGAEKWRIKLAAGSQVACHISLAHASLPITYCDSQLVPTEEMLRDFHPDVVDPVLTDNDNPPSRKEPLVKMKVTTFVNTGETTITWAFCHVLGDGLTFFRFTNMISQFYRGLPAVHPLPTYEAYFRPPPSLPRHLVAPVARELAPHLLQHYDREEAGELYARSFLSTTRLDMQFSLEEINLLKLEASRKAGQNVSKQDALAAYLITAINRVRKIPINQIINLVNVRGEAESPDGFQLPVQSAAGTQLLHVFSASIASEYTKDLGKVARYVGETVRQVRNADYVKRAAAATCAIMSQLFGANRQAFWGAGPNQVVLNNCYKLTSPDTHFGYPGRAIFVVNGSMERYIRIWAGNPTRNGDGTWNENVGSADVSFRLEHELAEPFMKLLAEDRRKWARATQLPKNPVPLPLTQYREELSLQAFSRL
ncbi:hypothetical protein DACRYDRAFT_22625 [Dacryopinax primogenitus]|uniref:Transferase-domain-containing protein n=1 Tax=Dacryopinax primogenitus (strain DJM 731) TaxID=1858805 RepID=M5FUR4_DACPD|nr:uncharacterized protein DACRYDRAFT_22625 [Dacryopinax primogenitus]EJU01506.1 hypothetical protein DACRYDRAFT_22625 [Dacryopinax primogenitus]